VQHQQLQAQAHHPLSIQVWDHQNLQLASLLLIHHLHHPNPLVHNQLGYSV